MSMGGSRGAGVRMRMGDPDAARAEIAAAPKVPHLGRRIAALFRNYRGVLALIVALVVVSAALSVLPPMLTQQAFDKGLFPPSGHPNLERLVVIVCAMVLVYAANSLLGVWQTYLTSSTGNAVMKDLRMQMFERLQSMEIGFFTRTKTGEIQSRLQNDVGGVSSVLTQTVSSVVGNIVTVIASLVAMLLLSPALTLVAIILMPPLVYFQRKVGVVRAKIAAETQESLSRMTAITQETLSISGVMLTKSFNRQKYETDRFGNEAATQVRLQVRQQMSGQGFFALVSLLMSSIPAGVYVVAGILSHNNIQVLTAGTIVAFTTVQARLLFPLVNLMQVSLNLQTSSALFARIFQYLDLKPAVTEIPHPTDLGSSHEIGRIDLDNVSFRYPGAQSDTISNISMHLAPGTFAAIVGPSGSGKSTIANLLPRYWDVESGKISIGGMDVRAISTQSLIDQIGILSQETYLFHATIAENLRYAKPEATQAELVHACIAANLHATIAKFPDKYETLVGERGYRLSGGEQQRLAIARVLLKNPPILILDEATSALDTISEHIVQQALDTASHGRTTVSIAHRLSTIVHADIIYVIVDGHLVEQGTHAELLTAGGKYAELYMQQQ